jgi:hypothetical protein
MMVTGRYPFRRLEDEQQPPAQRLSIMLQVGTPALWLCAISSLAPAGVPAGVPALYVQHTPCLLGMPLCSAAQRVGAATAAAAARGSGSGSRQGQGAAVMALKQQGRGSGAPAAATAAQPLGGPGPVTAPQQRLCGAFTRLPWCMGPAQQRPLPLPWCTGPAQQRPLPPPSIGRGADMGLWAGPLCAAQASQLLAQRRQCPPCLPPRPGPALT